MYIYHGLSSEFLLILTEYSSDFLLCEKRALVDELENLFFAELVIIPWDRYEMYGHADGMVRWIDGDRVLINNYGYFDPSHGRDSHRSSVSGRLTLFPANTR